MNFADDPLDILSDGSNDSFFEEPKPSKKSTKVTDLFNLAEAKKSPSVLKKPTFEDATKSEDWLGVEKKSPAKMAKKISFEDERKDDWLGLTKKAPTRETSLEDLSKDDWLGRKQQPVKSDSFNLLDDILGKNEGRAKSTTDIRENIVRDNVKETISLTSQVDAPREGRRTGRRPSPSLPDPLGLFSNDEPPPKVEEPKKPDNNPVPNWLQGKDNPSKPTPKPEAAPKEVQNIHQDNQFMDQLITQQKLAQSSVEYQNHSLALQQQESQVLMALQFKKYEENLKEMHRKQEDVLKKQEQQFGLLLEQQLAKQQIMENNMRLQQERINNHIQLLISQPSLSRTDLTSASELNLDIDKETKREDKEIHYEHLISTMKERHNEEIFLLEESYKKQISLLEQSQESLEKILKSDTVKLSEAFEEKLRSAQSQHQEELVKYRDKIQLVESRHAEELQQTKDNYLRLIDEIKRENYLMVENIKEVKKSETSMFSESTTYLQKLDSNLEVLYTNSKSLQAIQDRVDKDHGVLTRAREESLKAKEEEINSTRASLEKLREQSEIERSQLLALVRTLETKLCEQTQNSREDRWTFQQAASMLAARSAALDREAEFTRQSLEREREQLQAAKVSLLAEQEQSVLRLTEERLALGAERARLETATKLQAAHEMQRGRIESEAAIQVAKETTDKLESEREFLAKETCNLEVARRKLQDEERSMRMREKHVEDLRREAETKMAEGERTLAEAKNTEVKYQERMRDLQNQLMLLSSREKKLAEEKIAIAKERLELNTNLKQQKKCSLCNAEDNVYINDMSRFRMDEDDFCSNPTLFE